MMVLFPLYVAFGPAKNPEIAIAVVVENGGYGSKSAAPIAKAIFQTYFSKQQPTSGVTNLPPLETSLNEE
jgi:penicillin-binding protein 2